MFMEHLAELVNTISSDRDCYYQGSRSRRDQGRAPLTVCNPGSWLFVAPRCFPDSAVVLNVREASNLATEASVGVDGKMDIKIDVSTAGMEVAWSAWTLRLRRKRAFAGFPARDENGFGHVRGGAAPAGNHREQTVRQVYVAGEKLFVDRSRLLKGKITVISTSYSAWLLQSSSIV